MYINFPFPLSLLALLPTLLANPLPQEPAPPSAIVSSAASAAGSVVAYSSVRAATSSVPASAVRSAATGSVIVSRSAAAPRPTGALGQVPFGVYYEDPANGTRIHPYGRRDLCVIVVNDTVTEGSVLELGRCLNNTMPYPGSRNLFNITRPFDILPLNETDTVGANRTNATGTNSSTTSTSRVEPLTVEYVTAPSSAAGISGSLESVAALPSGGVASISRSPAMSSAYRPTGIATSSRAGPTTSAAAVPLPDEIGLYEGLIAPAGQNEYCLSGDIFDPYAEDDEDDEEEEEGEGDASGMAARQLATTTLSGSSALGPIRSPAPQSSGRSAVRSIASGIATATATATASGSAPSASASTSGRVRGPLDGLITLKRCNASDPAQWWRFGADVRVTVPGVAPGQGWKLSLRNQTQCATILGVSPQDRSPSRVFKMYPCVSNGQSQLLYIVNNGTTASGARDDTASATNMTDTAGADADADADAENAAPGSIAAPGYGSVVGSLLISASVALWATAW